MGGRIRADYASWKRYGAAVVDLGKRLGWNSRELWDYFWFFTLLCMYELRLPLEVAEDSAWRLLRGTIDKNAVANEQDGWVH